MKIDIEKDRKLLGLPGRHTLISTPVKWLAGALLTLLFAYGAGLMADLARQRGEAALSLKMCQAAFSSDLMTLSNQQMADLSLSLGELANKAADGKLILAQFYMMAAEMRPERELWLRAAQFELEKLSDKNDRLASQAALFLSGIEAELGNDYKALEILRGVEPGDTPEECSSYYNQEAYILASTAKAELRDGRRALELMQNEVMNQPQNWLVGAYLDTLAESFFASGKYKEALIVQRRALALAGESDVWTYLEHYKKYKAHAEKF